MKRASLATALTVSAILLIPTGAVEAARRTADPEARWETLEGGEIAVLHHRDDARYAERVLSIYDQRATSIAHQMGLTTLSPLRVLIAGTNEEFAELSYFGAPDWGVGIALPERGLVVLKSPRIVSYPLQMEAVVEHELAHMAAGRVLRGIDVPRWFSEGLAQAVAGEWRLSQSGVLAGAAASGRLPPLSALEGGFPEGRAEAAMAYAMSFQGVRLMMELADADSPGELVRAIRMDGDFDAALKTLTGLDRRGLDREYLRFMERRFRWGTILRDGRWLFLVGAAVFIAAFVVRRRRARSKMREWDEQEGAGDESTSGSSAAGDSRWG